jgi:hypothetical protein
MLLLMLRVRTCLLACQQSQAGGAIQARHAEATIHVCYTVQCRLHCSLHGMLTSWLCNQVEEVM